MRSKIQFIYFSIIFFVCLQIPAKAQENNLKLPYIQKILITYDSCLTIDSFRNLEKFKSLFHKDAVDTIKIIHDLYFTGSQDGFMAKSPLTINQLNQVFASRDNSYITNIKNTFLQFGERVTMRSKFGYKMYQFKFNKQLYYENYRKGINEFKEIPYYITLLSYDDPNNSTQKSAKIIRVSNKETIYPSRYLPESLTFDFNNGINFWPGSTGVSDQNSQGYNLKANFLLTGKKHLNYYFQLGAGYSKSDFNINLSNFSESYSDIDMDGNNYTKHGAYTDLSQKISLSFLEIPIALKAQYYQYKNVFNVFVSAGLSYYIPLDLNFSNTKGFAEYYGSYQFGNDFSIDLKNLPEYGFSKYSVLPSNDNLSIKPLISANVMAGINLRINKSISLEAGVTLKHFMKDINLTKTLNTFSQGEGIVAPFIQKRQVQLSASSMNLGITYNLSPVRSPYYPIIDKRLLNLKGNNIRHGALTTEKIKLSPSSDYIMKGLKTLDYQFSVHNQNMTMRGKIAKKGGNYYLKVKIPKELNSFELIKPIPYDLYSGMSEVSTYENKLAVNLNNKGNINISKIPDLDIIVLLKFTNSPPDNKEKFYDKMSENINSICSKAKMNERVLFANDSIQIIKPVGNCDKFSTYLLEIQNQFSITDQGLIEKYKSALKRNGVTTKGRNVNLHMIYLYKDMLFNTFEQSKDFLQIYPGNENFISKMEKEVFGNDYNTINVNIWSNYTPDETNLLNRYKSINQINWEYKIY